MLSLLYRWFRSPRSRLQDVTLGRRLGMLALWVMAVCAAHVIAMMVLEGMALRDALWLTATTIVTVGYGDLFAKTDAGRLATVGFMYVGGIFVVASLVSALVDWRTDSQERKANGTWGWKLTNHLLLIGEPSGDAVQHLCRLVDQVRAHEDWRDTPILLLTRAFEATRLPAVLADRGVVHVTGSAADATALDNAAPDRAQTSLVFSSSETDREATARVLDTVLRLREGGQKTPIIAECVDLGDRDRLVRLGAAQPIRVMHGYPEVAARAIVSPGSEALIEQLFTAEGDECRRIDLPRAWEGTWLDLLTRIAGAGIGTPIGYLCADTGAVLANPVGRSIRAKALFLIVGDDRQVNAARDTARTLFN
jgi:voltage-gated potassium channel